MPPLLATSPTPSVGNEGTSGATAYGYKLVGVDANGKKGAVSVEGTTATGNAVLDVTNFNRLTWTDVAGYVSYEIHRTSSSGTPATTGLIGTVLSGVQTFDDVGLAVTDATAPNATNQTGDGASTDTSFFEHDMTLYGTGIGTGTYQVQVSPDDTNWFNEGSALTASGFLNSLVKSRFVRFKCTAFTSGTPVGWVVG